MHIACMNKHIQIRNFDGNSHARLVERASSKGLSLSEFLRQELTVIAQEKPTLAEFYSHLRKQKGVHLKISAEQIIREERDRRS